MGLHNNQAKNIVINNIQIHIKYQYTFIHFVEVEHLGIMDTCVCSEI